MTPAQQAYGLLWREARVSASPLLREARTVLLRSMSHAEQRAAIEWVTKLHPLNDAELEKL